MERRFHSRLPWLMSVRSRSLVIELFLPRLRGCLKNDGVLAKLEGLKISAQPKLERFRTDTHFGCQDKRSGLQMQDAFTPTFVQNGRAVFSGEFWRSTAANLDSTTGHCYIAQHNSPRKNFRATGRSLRRRYRTTEYFPRHDCKGCSRSISAGCRKGTVTPA